MFSIFLVGFMGSGKTTVGRLLAERIDWAFVDLDDRIVAAEGRTINEIFSRGGEFAFRAAERRALLDVVTLEDTVVATGGGLFSVAENRRLITAAGGWSVFLDVPWAVLEERLGSEDSSRPLWTSPSSARTLFENRVDDYRRADTTLAIDSHDDPSVVAEAIILLRPELACAI